MSFFLGIDPGGAGAFAFYDDEANALIRMADMPVYVEKVGAKKRQRVDARGVASLCEYAGLLGVKLAVIEAVGGRPGEGAAGAFAFGYGYGLVMMALMYNGVPTETIAPATWKTVMRVPGKSKATPGQIVALAEQMFPADPRAFRGPRGGLRPDRAEASMLAAFAAKHVDRVAGTLGDVETRAIDKAVIPRDAKHSALAT